MADTPTSYRMWKSAEGVLIQAGGSSIELSTDDALTLAAEIMEQVHAVWTPELSAECVRLYVDCGWGTPRIGKRFGVSDHLVNNWLKKAGVQKRPGPGGAAAPITARAALAAKRAAKAQ